MKHSLLTGCLFLIASTAAFSQQSVPLSGSTSGLLSDLNAEPNPEPEWDVVGTNLGSLGLTLLVRNDDASDPVRLAETTNAALHVTEEAIVDEHGVWQTTSGSVGALLTSGAVTAFEVDLFEDPYCGVADPVLGVDALLDVVVLQDDQGQNIGHIYLYDTTLAAGRIASVVSYQRSAFLGDLIHTSNVGSKSVKVLGSDNAFIGPVRSSGGMKVGGFGQSFDGPVLRTHQWMQLSPGVATFTEVPAVAPATALRSTPETAGYYSSHPNAVVLSGDVTVLSDQGVLSATDGAQTFAIDGKILVTDGSIDVDGIGLTGSVTLIAGEVVNFSSSSSQLTPAETDLLLWAQGGNVNLDGSANVLQGAIFSSNVVSFSGSDNDFVGTIDAAKFKATGSGNSLRSF